jgi:serine/threonine protein kinase
MISKIIHYENYATLPDIALEQYVYAISKFYHENEGERIEIFSTTYLTGTLGVTLKGMLNGQSVFIKSHKPSLFHKYNLEKEFLFLKSVYRDTLVLRIISFFIKGSQFSAIVMTELQGAVTFNSLEQGLKTIESCLVDLVGTSLELENHRKFLVTSDYRFSFLYKKSFYALEFLETRNYISKKLKLKFDQMFTNCGSEVLSELCFCHGDLSSKNIMLHGMKPILVDWEDAMLGSKLFDISYWMTFMEQRKYYNSPFFKEFISKNRDVLFYMSIILLLKGYLSVLDGSVQNNNLSIQERIDEISDFF